MLICDEKITFLKIFLKPYGTTVPGLFLCENTEKNFELFGLFSVLVKGFLKIPVRRMEDQKGIPDSMSRPFPAALGRKTGCGRKE